MTESKNVRPKNEDVIKDFFTGEALDNILNLISFLRENKMNPTCSSKSSWISRNKKRVVCRFNIDNGTLRVTPIIGNYSADSLSDEHKKIVWAKVEDRVHGCWNCEGGTHCSHLGLSSNYGMKIVFGKKYDENVCGQSICFINPNSCEVECIKELIKLRKSFAQMEN